MDIKINKKELWNLLQEKNSQEKIIKYLSKFSNYEIEKIYFPQSYYRRFGRGQNVDDDNAENFFAATSIVMNCVENYQEKVLYYLLKVRKIKIPRSYELGKPFPNAIHNYLDVISRNFMVSSNKGDLEEIAKIAWICQLFIQAGAKKINERYVLQMQATDRRRLLEPFFDHFDVYHMILKKQSNKYLKSITSLDELLFDLRTNFMFKYCFPAVSFLEVFLC
jgi:hypothetical protein